MDQQKIVYGLFTVLLTVLGWMAVMGLNNNTKAMDRLSCSLDRIEERIGSHDVVLKEHSMSLGYHDERLKKGGL